MKIADKTVLSVVFFAMQVGFMPVCFAMGDRLMVVFQQMVQLLKGNGLKEDNCQEIGNRTVICWTEFQNSIIKTP